MNWLVWRLYRKQIILTGLAVVIYAVLLVVLGNQAWDKFNDALAAKKVASFNLPPLADTLPKLSLAFPILLGMFWGAPLIAKEYAEGTHKLAWVQGVTRRKWLIAKLGWIMAFGALYAGIISAAVMWCNRAENAIRFDRFTAQLFTMQGLAPVAYTIFAIALGACVGAFFRSSVRSVAITLAVGSIIIFTVATHLRPHYMRPVSAPSASNIYPAINIEKNTIMPGAGAIWVVGTEYKTLSKDCSTIKGNQFCNSVVQSVKTMYQPANRFWTFQFIEFGLYVVVSAILSLLTYRVIQKRDV